MLLDLLLPKITGGELLETLREHPTWRTIPVIVLTGSMARSQLDRARELKAHAILHKAKFGVEELLTEIRKAIKPKREPVAT
jgi:CheY-like chemotaxis protein